MTDLSKLPRYQSHKTVRAVAITGIACNEDGDIVTVIPAQGEPIPVTGNPFKANPDRMPAPGDYLVVYDNADGTLYMSWSPKATFEEGYSKLEPYQKPRA